MADNKAKAPVRIAPVPDGFRRVRHVYNPDKTVAGTVVDMPAHEAAHLKAENRVAYVDPQTPLSVDVARAATRPAPDPEPAETPAPASAPEPEPEVAKPTAGKPVAAGK